MKTFTNNIKTLSLFSMIAMGALTFVFQNYEVTIVPNQAYAESEDCVDEYSSEENCTDDYDYQCDF